MMTMKTTKQYVVMGFSGNVVADEKGFSRRRHADQAYRFSTKKAAKAACIYRDDEIIEIGDDE
jgi:hypothetical protein